MYTHNIYVHTLCIHIFTSTCHVSVCSSVLCLVTTEIWSVTALGSWIDRVIALKSQKDHVIALRQISVTAQCYSSILFR